MDRLSCIAENDASRVELRALTARLSDADLARPIGHGWTVSSTLAHLAFWDQRNLATLREWQQSGVRVVPIDPDPINDAMLPQWLAMPPREALAEAFAAAQAVDRLVADLSDELIEAILAQRPRTVIRAMHRRQHLGEIERALAGTTPS
ncbi:MAG TPA: DinB family protein [Anaerolineae bacterium]|nr:DinB family protein [Anaerolineae bacterium]HOR00691.1 DinB family protein [Anaerolineae bacterium]HPL27259.1 DinB family protein [Anaerolineae bacterium]HPL27264.1 DinB family protein [Anaerolineae bacterium]